MHSFRHLMVALPPEAHAGLIRYTAALAKIGVGEEFRFVCVLPADPDPARSIDSLEADVQAAFAGTPEGVKVYVDVLKGPLLDRLLEFAAEQEVDLLLVGHAPQHSGRRALARRLAMKAPCSVWMAPGEPPPSFSRILVPIDFSPPAADALSAAVALARLRGLDECLALHVYFDPGVARYDEYDAVLRGQEQAAFDKFLATVDCQGVRVEPVFVESANVSHAIERVAKERGVDLIVMSTRGRTRSAAILLGSETDQTLIETHTPILVVKHFGAHLGLLSALLNKEFKSRDELRFG